MNKTEREIMFLLRKSLDFVEVVNPCDIKGLVGFYNSMSVKIKTVRGYLDDLSCFDIPNYRKKEIISELKRID